MKRLGRYEILRELGHGAMGRVFLGLDPQIGREVALKTVNLFQLDTNLQEEFCKRFFHEAQAAGRLLHPGIVTIFDVGEDPATKTPFLVLEYVEGSTLDMVMSESRFERGSALQVAREIAEALDFAHAHGIVHRDIKPSNILLTREGRAKITDFGVARLPTAPSTDTGAVLGTPHYMAPEQLGGKRVDGRTDLFALGTILYRLLSGVEPFAGDSLSNVFFQIMFTDPAPVSSLEPELGPDFDYVLDRALAKEPARRYQKGAELAADLEDLQLGAPPRSRAALRKASEEEPEPATPPPEPPVPAAPTQHRKTPTVKTEPMASWPLVATTVKLLSFIREPRRPSLLGAVVVMLLVVAVGTFAWQMREVQLGLATPAGMQSQSMGAPLPANEGPAKSGAGDGEEAGPARAPAKVANPEPKPAVSAPATSKRSGKKSGAAREPATIFVVGEHNFREATLHLFAGEQSVGQLELTSKEGESSRFSTNAPVKPGGHTITVIAEETNGSFNQRASIDGEFSAGQSRLLEVRISRAPQSIWMGKKLSLRWLD